MEELDQVKLKTYAETADGLLMILVYSSNKVQAEDLMKKLGLIGVTSWHKNKVGAEIFDYGLIVASTDFWNELSEYIDNENVKTRPRMITLDICSRIVEKELVLWNGKRLYSTSNAGKRIQITKPPEREYLHQRTNDILQETGAVVTSHMHNTILLLPGSLPSFSLLDSLSKLSPESILTLENIRAMDHPSADKPIFRIDCSENMQTPKTLSLYFPITFVGDCIVPKEIRSNMDIRIQDFASPTCIIIVGNVDKKPPERILYKLSSEWKLPVLDLQWLHECLQAKRIVSTENRRTFIPVIFPPSESGNLFDIRIYISDRVDEFDKQKLQEIARIHRGTIVGEADKANLCISTCVVENSTDIQAIVKRSVTSYSFFLFHEQWRANIPIPTKNFSITRPIGAQNMSLQNCNFVVFLDCEWSRKYIHDIIGYHKGTVFPRQTAWENVNADGKTLIIVWDLESTCFLPKIPACNVNIATPSEIVQCISTGGSPSQLKSLTKVVSLIKSQYNGMIKEEIPNPFYYKKHTLTSEQHTHVNCLRILLLLQQHIMMPTRICKPHEVIMQLHKEERNISEARIADVSKYSNNKLIIGVTGKTMEQWDKDKSTLVKHIQIAISNIGVRVIVTASKYDVQLMTPLVHNDDDGNTYKPISLATVASVSSLHRSFTVMKRLLDITSHSTDFSNVDVMTYCKSCKSNIRPEKMDLTTEIKGLLNIYGSESLSCHHCHKELPVPDSVILHLLQNTSPSN